MSPRGPEQQGHEARHVAEVWIELEHARGGALGFDMHEIRKHGRLRTWVAVFVAVYCCTSTAASVAPVAAEHGMVVTAQHLATKVGVDILKRGGNAIDAAVAVGYALAVTYPAAGNLGGSGFMTIVLDDGRRTFIDFREQAPLAATPDMFLESAGNVVPGRSTAGHLAVAVPGTVAGLEYARIDTERWAARR